LPCLSVRTGLDLFLRVMNYPPGTEVIMSAVNIPDMIRVIHAHHLKIIALDVDLETMAPKMHLLGSLVTDKTKVLLVANVFGRRFDMDPVIKAAQAYGLVVIEDFAEGFGGFDYLGHKDADLALFSFGPIKYETAFGGGIAKVRDSEIYAKMLNVQQGDPVQPQLEYLKKVLKYAFVYLFLNSPSVIRPTLYWARRLNIDHKKHAIGMLRGFPDRLMERLRHQPCNALLAMMHLRFMEYDLAQHQLTNVKHEYVGERLPAKAVPVGNKAYVRNHWLCPIIVVRLLHQVLKYCLIFWITFLTHWFICHDDTAAPSLVLMTDRTQ
jgi:perosamine synthetase